MDEKCLEFIKIEDEPELAAVQDEIWPVNIQQGRDLDFITIHGSPSIDDSHDVSNIATKDNNCYACNKSDGADNWEVTYKFVKPILIRGYILQTGDGGEEFDPKDWKINCKNFFTQKEEDIHTVTDEEKRDRLAEKIYRIDEEKRPIWTDKIAIRISALQDDTKLMCHIN